MQDLRMVPLPGSLPEAYQWLLVPEQTLPQSSVQWQAYRLSGQESLALRARQETPLRRAAGDLSRGYPTQNGA